MNKYPISLIITGLLIFILFVLAMKLYSKTTQLSGNTVESNSYPSDNTRAERISLLFLGDSYTIGQGIESTGSWPSQLQIKLREQGILLNDAKVIAGNGWSSSELIEQFLYIKPKGTYDLAFIQIGVNDQFRGRNKESYKSDFDRLVELTLNVVENDPEKIIVLSIPDYSVTPSGNSNNPDLSKNEIDEFNRINKEVSEKYGLNYINITDLSRSAFNNPELIAPDGLHFSAGMYDKWVEHILPVVLEIASK